MPGVDDQFAPLLPHLVLSEVDQDIGAASSLMMFSVFVLGAVAMGLISLKWPDKIQVLGIMSMATGGLIFLFLLLFFNSKS